MGSGEAPPPLTRQADPKPLSGGTGELVTVTGGSLADEVPKMNAEIEARCMPLPERDRFSQLDICLHRKG